LFSDYTEKLYLKLAGETMDNKKIIYISKIYFFIAALLITFNIISANEQSNTAPDIRLADTKLILIERIILDGSRELLREIGLYEKAMKISDTWLKYSIDKSSDPNVFIIDQSKTNLIHKILIRDFLINEMGLDDKSTDPNVFIIDPSHKYLFQNTVIKLEDAINPYNEKTLVHPENLITFKGFSPSYYVYSGQILIDTDIELTPSLDANNNIKLDMHIHITDTVYSKIEFRLNNVIKQKGKRLQKAESIDLLVFKDSTNFTVFEKSFNAIIPDEHTLVILGPEVTHNISHAASRPLIDLPFVDNLIKVTSRYTFQTIPLTFLKFKILTPEEAEKLSKESNIPIYPRQ